MSPHPTSSCDSWPEIFSRSEPQFPSLQNGSPSFFSSCPGERWPSLAPSCLETPSPFMPWGKTPWRKKVLLLLWGEPALQLFPLPPGGAAGFPAGLGQHLRNLPVHVSLALLIPHYLLICFICLLVYGPNHPGCKFLES